MEQFDIFGGEPVELVAPVKKKRRVRPGWDLIPHACRHCHGRMLRRENPDGTVVVRCAECGASVAGEHDALCCCGIEVRGHGRVFECIVNPHVSNAMPQEVLVREKPLIRHETIESNRRSNPVNLPGGLS